LSARFYMSLGMLDKKKLRHGCYAASHHIGAHPRAAAARVEYHVRRRIQTLPVAPLQKQPAVAGGDVALLGIAHAVRGPVDPLQARGQRPPVAVHLADFEAPGLVAGIGRHPRSSPCRPRDGSLHRTARIRSAAWIEAASAGLQNIQPEHVQAAIERDPATFKKLKRVVMMGGSIERGYDGAKGERRGPDAEWNINRDPAGARALLAAGVPVFMMPLDSTQIHLEAKEREEIFSHGSPLTDQLTLLYHQWMALSEWHPAGLTLFDPVAVAYAIRPDLCPATPMRLEVDSSGFTRPVEGAPNAQVCLQSDEKGFLELLLERIATDKAH